MNIDNLGLGHFVDHFGQEKEEGTSEVELRLDLLHPFPENYYPPYPQHKLEAFAEQIRTDGILVPIIVRPHPCIEGEYEILAGHNRVAASKLAGKETIPAVIKKDLPEETVYKYVIYTNLGRNNSDISPIALAKILKMDYDHITRDPEAWEEVKKEVDSITGTKSQGADDIRYTRPRDYIAANYDINGRMIEMYLNLNKLTDEWKAAVDSKSLPIALADKLSRFTPSSQSVIFEESQEKGVALKKEMLDEFRKREEMGTLTKKEVSKIVGKYIPAKKEATVKMTIEWTQEEYDKYFSHIQSRKVMEDFVKSSVAENFRKTHKDFDSK